MESGDQVNVPDLELGVPGQEDRQADTVGVELEPADPGRGGDELGEPGYELLGAGLGGDGGGHPDQELRHQAQGRGVLLLGAEHPDLQGDRLDRDKLPHHSAHLLTVVAGHHDLGVRGVHAQGVAVHSAGPLII